MEKFQLKTEIERPADPEERYIQLDFKTDGVHSFGLGTRDELEQEIKELF
jgi:hypothetical protein